VWSDIDALITSLDAPGLAAGGSRPISVQLRARPEPDATVSKDGQAAVRKQEARLEARSAAVPLDTLGATAINTVDTQLHLRRSIRAIMEVRATGRAADR
jgi:hypothetical protein